MKEEKVRIPSFLASLGHYSVHLNLRPPPTPPSRAPLIQVLWLEASLVLKTPTIGSSALTGPPHHHRHPDHHAPPSTMPPLRDEERGGREQFTPTETEGKRHSSTEATLATGNRKSASGKREKRRKKEKEKKERKKGEEKVRR